MFALLSFSKMSHYASFHRLFHHPLDLVVCVEGKAGKESKQNWCALSTKLLKNWLILQKEITF